MNSHFLIKFVCVLFASFALKQANAQFCVDYDDLPNPYAFYNSFTEFPSGSLLHQFGDIKMYNKYDVLHPTNPTILDSITDAADPFDKRLHFKGMLIFDVSEFPSECKKVKFAVGTDSIFIDSYVILPSESPTFPLSIGDSILVTVDNGLVVTGKFSTVAFQADLTIKQESFLDEFCIQNCLGTEDCKIDFDFDVMDSVIDFTNLSSFSQADAESFIWSFPGTDTSLDENPTYEISENGSHEVCLTITRSACILGGPTLNKCDNVEINIEFPESNFLTEDDHFILSPNDDGVQDYVNLKAGSKIFNRHGHLIVEYFDDKQWTGTGSNDLLLPTGLYTVLNNGTTFQITLVR